MSDCVREQSGVFKKRRVLDGSLNPGKFNSLQTCHTIASSLNGNNGEWTNGDDMGGKKLKIQMSQKNANLKEIQRRAKQSAKDKLLSGKGAYFADSMTPINMSGSGSYSLSKVGGSVGKMLGGKSGKKIGAGLGAVGDLLTGRGNYVTNNTFSSNGTKSGFGEFLTDTAGNITGYAFREFLGYAFAPTVAGAFQTTSFSVNPGLSDTFPFLSAIATNYTSYSFEQLVFSFESLSGMATTGAVGNVVLCPDYNSSADPPINEEDAEMRPNAVSGVLISNLVCGIECDPRKLGRFPGLFVRAGALQANQDIKTFDHCKFYVSVYGVNNTVYPTGSKIGKVYAYYKVNLINPKIYDTLGFANPVDQFVSGGTLSNAIPLGTLCYRGSKNVIGGLVSRTGTSVYTFPDNYAGVALVMFVYYGSGLSGANSLVASGQLTAYNALCSNDALQTFTHAVTTSAGGELVAVGFWTVARANTSGENKITVSLGGSTTKNGGNLFVLTFNPLNGKPDLSRFYVASNVSSS